MCFYCLFNSLLFFPNKLLALSKYQSAFIFTMVYNICGCIHIICIYIAIFIVLYFLFNFCIKDRTPEPWNSCMQFLSQLSILFLHSLIHIRHSYYLCSVLCFRCKWKAFFFLSICHNRGSSAQWRYSWLSFRVSGKNRNPRGWRWRGNAIDWCE